MSVPAAIAPTLGKLIPLLASNHDGEVVATARAIERLLKSNGRDLHDLAAVICLPAVVAPGVDWRREARFCAANLALLSDREIDFLATLSRWRGCPTDKQLKWLRTIADRLRGGI